MTLNFYAGIGSRETPDDILDLMRMIASKLSSEKWILRSGGAKGADRAFEDGCDELDGEKEIFLAKDAPEWSFDKAIKYIPSDRPPFKNWQPYIRSLIARDMQQILGKDGDSLTDFVICWTANGKDSGGTGYAIRCAKDHSIPIYNLKDKKNLARLKDWILS